MRKQQELQRKKMTNPPTEEYDNDRNIKPQNYGYANNGMSQNTGIDYEDLVDAYIGKNADKLKNGGFSGCVFFFGFLYVL